MFDPELELFWSISNQSTYSGGLLMKTIQISKEPEG